MNNQEMVTLEDDGPAFDLRRQITSQVQNFEKALSETQQSRFTAFFGGNAVSMRLNAISSSEAGFITLVGTKDDGEAIVLGINYAALTYTIEVVQARNPVRFGFGS